MRKRRRVQLAVPANIPKLAAKAAASDADHIFLDLEDSVPPQDKEASRQLVIEALKGNDWGNKIVSVRVNDITTEYCYRDCVDIVEAAGDRLDTIMLPKAISAFDIRFIDTLLTQIETRKGLKRRIGIEPIIEDVKSLQNVDEIASASNRLQSLIFGVADYTASHGADPALAAQISFGDLWYYARFRIVVAARAAGIDAIDCGYEKIKDIEGYAAECRRAKAMGFVGKWAIHPSHIAPALEVFSPSEAEISQARRIVDAYREAAAQGKGAIAFEGKLIDAASLRTAEMLLEQAGVQTGAPPGG